MVLHLKCTFFKIRIYSLLFSLISFSWQGTLRVLLVLLHDFPEFLCDYHYTFCDVIPPNCIQMRNLILSAFPRNMRLPDPFTPNLKVDSLPDITQSPRILTDYVRIIQPASFKKVWKYFIFLTSVLVWKMNFWYCSQKIEAVLCLIFVRSILFSKFVLFTQEHRSYISILFSSINLL